MTIGDKCPYCGRELLSGYLQSARQIIWSQEEKSISFRADEDGDLVVSHGIWEGSFADCRYCADCGIFLLERPAQPPKFGERLRGIRCGAKPTSCPDQLSKALQIALAEEAKRAGA